MIDFRHNYVQPTKEDGLENCIICGKQPLIAKYLEGDGYGNYTQGVTCPCLDDTCYVRVDESSSEPEGHDAEWNEVMRKAKARIVESLTVDELRALLDKQTAATESEARLICRGCGKEVPLVKFDGYCSITCATFPHVLTPKEKQTAIDGTCKTAAVVSKQ